MNSDASSLVIQKCEEILQDSEVSALEVYSLAEWLNSHPEACDIWPGNLLVGPLQNMWSDGKTTKGELSKFARTMGAILRENSKRIRDLERQQSVAQKKWEIEESISAFDPTLGVMPTLAVTIKVRSFTERGVIYVVNLLDHSCTCADWLSYRFRIPVGSPSRCCKHVLEALSRVAPAGGWPSWLGFLSESGLPIRPQANIYVMATKNGTALIYSGKPPWWNILAPEGRHYSSFGFNTDESRWSHGISPDGAMEFRRFFRTVC